MTLGRAAEKAGRNEEAVEHYRRAKVEFPRAEGRDDPRRELARIYLGLGQKDAAVRETAETVAQSETAVEERMVMAGVQEAAGDAAAAARTLREIIDILPVPGTTARGRAPFPAAEVHARLGRALLLLDRAPEAADSFRLAAIVGRTCAPNQSPAAVAGWLVEQAKAAALAGRAAEAKSALEEAIRIDPSNAEAEELLRSRVK
jgi:tetratricopeptide (TPR) repeat protein